jgi:glutamyl-tRNA synthetase
MPDKPVITRFAPSPTGVLHVGSARTALFNYLYARKTGGQCILRIEDTDRARSTKEYEDNIRQGLSWLGITFDADYRQSDRVDVYAQYTQQLIDSGHAYISKEKPTEGNQRSEVIRFKNPNTRITFTDAIRGEISFDTTELGDFVIAKTLREPLYHLAVVIDDFAMRVTHIIRGEDGISNTPRQILIQEALGAPRPVYAHIPLILAPDRSKLSKRHGAKDILEYRDEGYLPEAVVNFLALMGWNPGDEREVFTLPELIESFSLDRIQKAGAIFNPEKLEWINKEHMKRLPQNVVLDHLQKALNVDQETAERIAPVVMERISTWGELQKMAQEGEFTYMISEPEYPIEKLLWKDEPDKEKTQQRLVRATELLKTVPDNEFSAEATKSVLWEYATAEGRGSVLWPIRYALSGKDKSPDPFTLAHILGKETTLARIEKAIGLLQ